MSSKLRNFRVISIVMILLVLSSVIVTADGWTTQPSHQTLYVDTLTSKTDGSSVSVADSQGLFVTGDLTTLGEVGVGTASPGFLIDVKGAANPTINVDDTDGTGARFVIQNSGATKWTFQNILSDVLEVSSGTANNIITATQGGNVGIGTANPTYKLDVSGQIHSSGDICTDAGGGKCLSNVSGGGSSQWTTTGSDIYYNTGNVGIKSVNPLSELDVTGQIKISSTINDKIVLSGTQTGPHTIYLTDSKGLRFWDSVNNELVRITNDGKMGIGTNNPLGDLHIERSSGDPDIKFTDVSQGSFMVGMPDGTNSFEIAEGNALGTNSRFRIINGGNVGIGTNSPDRKLTVYEDTAGTASTIKIHQADNTNLASHSRYEAVVGGASGGDPVVTFTVTGIGAWHAGVDNSDGDKFKISQSDQGLGTGDKLIIQTDGNVGIGTNPVSGGTLTVASGINAIQTGWATERWTLEIGDTPYGVSSSDSLSILHNGGTTGDLNIIPAGSADTTKWTVFKPSGNVGIGTNSPINLLSLNRADAFLNINSVGSGAGKYSIVSFSASGAGKFQVGLDGDLSSNKFSIWNNQASNYALTIDSNSNVGIGTTAPDALLDLGGTTGRKLHVYRSGNLKAGFGIDLSGSQRELSAYFGDGGTGTNMGHFSIGKLAEADGTTFTELMRINKDGNVGIGTTGPSARLHVSTTGEGSVIFEGDRDNSGQEDNYLVFYVDGQTQDGRLGWDNNDGTIQFTNSLGNSFYFGTESNLPVQFYTNNDAKMIIEPGGNVGIGTTTPTHKLHVAGSIKLSPYNSGIFLRNFANTADANLISVDGSANLQLGSNEWEIIYMDAGSEVEPLTDNKLKLGDSSNRWTAVYAVNGAIQTSDSRKKHDIKESGLGLEFIRKLRPVSFEYNDIPGKRHGLIAQEVMTALEDRPFEGGLTQETDTGLYGLNYAAFVTPLISATKELDKKTSEVYSLNGKVGIGTTNPGSKATVSGGDVYVSTTGAGIILKDSKDGSCHKITVEDDALSITGAIECPQS